MPQLKQRHRPGYAGVTLAPVALVNETCLGLIRQFARRWPASRLDSNAAEH